MANRYWVGGSGTWDNTSTVNWAATSGGAGGASAPTTSDAVIFDANSNAGTNDFTVTLGTSPACNSINTTGIDPATAMTIAGTGSLTIGGAGTSMFVILTSKVVWSHTGTVTIANTTSPGATINFTSGGVSIAANVTVNLAAGSTILNFTDNFTCTGSFTHSQGTITTTSSNKVVSLGQYLTAGTGLKTLNTGSVPLTITGNNATIVNLVAGTNLTISSPTTIHCTYSGSAGTRTVNVGSSLWAANAIQVLAGSDTFAVATGGAIGGLSFSGFSGTWTNTAVGLRTLTLGSGMTVGSGANALTFSGASGTITANGVTVDCPITINNTGFTTTISGDLTLGSSRNFTLSGGTVALGASTLTVGRFVSTGTTTRSVTRSTGNITVTGNAATVCAITGSGITMTGFTITSNYSGSVGTRTFNITTTNPAVAVTGGSDTVTFTTSNIIRSLDFTGFSGVWLNVALTINGSLTTSASMVVNPGANTVTFAGTGTITSNAEVFGFPVTVNGGAITVTLGDSLTVGSSRITTLTAGTLALGGNTLSTGIFTSSGTSTRAITRTSGNITVTGNAATIVTLTGSGATYGSGLIFTCNYSGSTGTRTLNIPGAEAAVNISSGSDSVTFTANNRVRDLDFTGFAGTWSNVALDVLGSLTVSSGMTVGSGANRVLLYGTGTITSNGKTLDFPLEITGGNVTLGDSLTLGSSRALTLSSVSLSNPGNYDVSIGTFSSSTTSDRTLDLGSGTWTVNGSGASAWDCSTSTNLTVTGTGTIKMTSASAKTFAGGGATWPTLENAGAGALTISGSNTFTTITNSVVPATLTFTSGTTQTVTNFTVSGTAGNLVTINSTTPGSQATLSDASGTVAVTFCQIQDSNATGGAIWDASGAGNIDLGNNTGWLFITGGGGGFLLFF